MTLHLFTYLVCGTDAAQLVAAALVRRSAWFKCMPLPDDQFEFTAKQNEGLERVMIDAASQAALTTGNT